MSNRDDIEAFLRWHRELLRRAARRTAAVVGGILVAVAGVIVWRCW